MMGCTWCTTILGMVAGLAAALLFSWLRGPKAMDLSGKHVLITGGSSGIGEACAIKCVALGAKVTLLARTALPLEEARKRVLASDVRTREMQVTCVSADVTDAAQMKAAVEKAEVMQGEVDMLICSAGITLPKKFTDIETADFERLMSVNFMGTVNSIKAAYASVTRKPGGRIVLVSSQAGQVGVFGYTAYSASKFALRGLAEALQMEVRPLGATVTVAYPPDTDTPQLEWENRFKPPETKLISDGGAFSPQQVANAIVGAGTRGQFQCYIGLDGWMLAKLTAGMSPQSVPFEVLVEVTLMPLFRLISLIYLKMWASQISTFQKQQAKLS
mmetsp:Transcript_678/g.1217  ORF Transcript_678/g.1217 Transcript_678/m.1217 type:complete len:330 (+) Transcript_678:106-1095(+)